MSVQKHSGDSGNDSEIMDPDKVPKYCVLGDEITVHLQNSDPIVATVGKVTPDGHILDDGENVYGLWMNDYEDLDVFVSDRNGQLIDGVTDIDYPAKEIIEATS